MTTATTPRVPVVAPSPHDLLAHVPLKHAQWEQWSTTMRIVVAQPEALEPANAMLRELLGRVEEAASRFRADSQVCRIARSNTTQHRASPLLAQLVHAALTAAEVSDGRVDPTVGSVIARLDTPTTVPGSVSTARRATWRDVDLQGQVLRMPAHTLLDLGATGKAFAADLAAQSISEALRCGVLVSLGGDLRVAGPDPAQGWSVLVQDGDTEPASMIDLRGARAVATSSTLHRRIGPDRAHHLIDPITLTPITPIWRTVTVAAPTCVSANTWSTAAIIAGAGGPGLLAATGLPARLVSLDGRVVLLGGWPA